MFSILTRSLPPDTPIMSAILWRGFITSSAFLLESLNNSIKVSSLITPNNAKIAKTIITPNAIFFLETFTFPIFSIPLTTVLTASPFLNNPLFDYLSSDPDDTFYEARFKNALEGAGIGGSLEVIVRTFRYIKNINKSRNKEKINKKQLEEDEKFLKDLDDDSIIQTRYKPLSQVEEKEFTKSLDTEDSCVCATTANITLSGTQTIDTISVSADDRVLVKNQTDASENGIYLCKSGSWVRTDDANAKLRKQFEVQQAMNAASVVMDTAAAIIKLQVNPLKKTIPLEN